MKKLLILTSVVLISAVLYVFVLDDHDFHVSENEIVFGQSCAMSGPAAKLGQMMYKGANAYFSHVNDTGGIDGKKIRLSVKDDFYEPHYAFKNAQEFISKENVFALFGEVGTPTSKAVMPIIEQFGVPFLMPFTGAEFLRDDERELVVNLRSSYFQETEALVTYLQSKKLNRIAVFYQNDSYGKAGYAGVKKALKKFDLDIVAEGRYRRNTLSYSNALNSIETAKPDAVIMIGAYKASAEFIKSAKKRGMSSTLFCNISFVGSKALVEALEGQTENVIISQVVPLPWNSELPAVREYQEIFSKYYPDQGFDFVSFEGFLAAKLVVKALRKSSPYISRISFLNAFQRLDKHALEGFEIKFGKTDNQALDSVYITDFHEDGFRVLKEVVLK